MRKTEIHELITQGVLQDEPDIELWKEELEQLVADGFLQNLPNQYYAFKSNLTWEVIYETLLYAERRHLHTVVAKHIEIFNADKIEAVADLLLHHNEEAGNLENCVYYGSIAGNRAANMFANDDAIQVYEKTLGLLEKSPNQTITDWCLLNEKIADTLEISGQYLKAIETYKKILKYWRKASNKPKPELVPWQIKLSTYTSELYRKIAVACERQSLYKESIRSINKALELLPSKPGRISAQIYAAKSVSLLRVGNYPEAIENGQKSLSIAKRLKNSDDIAYAYNMLANTFIEMGQLKKAVTNLKHAVSIYDDLKDFPGKASANSNLGSCFMLIGNLDDATRHYEITLKLDERMQNESNVAIDHNNLGEVLMAQGNIEEAINHLNKVFEAHKQEHVHGALTGYALMNISRCRIILDELDKAETALEQGLALLKDSGVQGVYIEAELQKAELLYLQDKHERALTSCKRTMKKITELDAKLLEARGERILGNIEASLGHIDQAITKLEKSIKVAAKIGAEHEEAKSLISLVRISNTYKTDKTSTNQRRLKKSIAILTQIGAKNEILEAKQLLAELS